MTCRDTQKAELAGKTKLTAVTMGHGGRRVQCFVMVKHDTRGHAILQPSQVLQVQDLKYLTVSQVLQVLTRLPTMRRGDTFTTG